MPLYGGIDLHANNSVVALIPTILEQLAPYHTDIEGLVVESTYNWY
jgi:transposase